MTFVSWELVDHVGGREARARAQADDMLLGPGSATASNSGTAERGAGTQTECSMWRLSGEKLVPSSLGTQATGARNAGQVYHYRTCGVSK